MTRYVSSPDINFNTFDINKNEVAYDGAKAASVRNVASDTIDNLSAQQGTITELESQQTPHKWSSSDLGIQCQKAHSYHLQLIAYNLTQMQKALKSFSDSFERITTLFQGQDEIQAAYYTKLMDAIDSKYQKSPNGKPDYNNPLTDAPSSNDGGTPSEDLTSNTTSSPSPEEKKRFGTEK